MRRAPLLSTVLSSCLLALSACGDDPPAPANPNPEPGTPSVTATSPAGGDEAQLPGALTQVSLTFSGPMDTSKGTLRPSSGLELGAPTWSGNTLTAPITRIGHDEEHTLTLEGFQDAQGQPVEHTLRFRTGTDRPRPVLTASSIPEGAQDVYPLELYFDHEARRPGIYSRKQLSLRFSVPMRTTHAQVKLENHTDSSIAPRVITGQWSDEGRELLLTLPAPEDGGPGGATLEEKSRYTLDLSALRGAEVGNRLDSAAFLGDGRLDFTTSERDGELEHACTHALANEAEAIQATTGEAPPFGFAPLTDTGHSRYRVTLPGEQQHGYTSLVSRPAQDEHIVLYLDRELAVGAYDGMESKDVAVKVEAARPVCTGITHVASFHALQGNRDYFLRFGPTPGAVFEFILERHAH
ncbi:Ig-like domain-containing protein [Cystobacter ferrugineus]|uniref:SbsA Ig-like domain-containing protein n=1 Tax=Cystobacter ferrugineus TaxID=83449 RepID=A0A1L9BG68_9BACT|nr:hypothetical protein [Cystobacter ferrugineus]OJH41262.1 hypothetical protein BON30_10325 [Cystobacter ferrugineus]